MTDSAAGLLATLTHRGVELRVIDDRLRYRPQNAVTAELLADLARHKHELLTMLGQMAVPALRAGTWGRCASALLARISDDDKRAKLREAFEERAAICQHDGCLNVDDAEGIAFRELYKAVIRNVEDDSAQGVTTVTSSVEDAGLVRVRLERNAGEGGNP